MRRSQRQFVLGEHFLPGSLRMQRRAVKHGSGGCFRAGIRKYIELLAGAVILARKAQQFKQKSAALGVEWLLLQLVTKRVDCRLQLAGTVERKRVHKKAALRQLVFLRVVSDRTRAGEVALLVLR